MPQYADFQTKPQMAQVTLERALESEVSFAWVTGRGTCVSGRNLRLRPEQEEIPHVLEVKTNKNPSALTDEGSPLVRAGRLASEPVSRDGAA